MRHIPLGVSIIPSARTVYHGAVGSVGASTRLSGPAQARKIELSRLHHGKLSAPMG